jgi:hypothetical protein
MGMMLTLMLMSLVVAVGAAPVLAQSTMSSSSLPGFDFRQPGAVAEWRELHDVARLETVSQGMAVHLSGEDPYFSGPRRDYPAGVPLLLKVRLRPSAGGYLQVFYFGPEQGTDEDRSIRVPVKRGVWQDATAFLPPLGPGFRLRLDPPGSREVCLIESIRFTPRLEITAPAWPKPTLPEVVPGAARLVSGPLSIQQRHGQLGGFTVHVEGRLVASGHDRPLIGYLEPAPKLGKAPAVRWLNVAKLARVSTGLDPNTGALTIEARLQDPDGGGWRLTQEFRPGPAGAIAVTAGCAVDQPRAVVFLPMILLLPGHGSFGALKGQGLFAGVEYLENEPSSSTADLNEQAGANRKVPDSDRITFPLMAVQAHGDYVGVIWDRAPELAALFDSPDRTFGGQGHILGLIAPGANGTNRKNGELFPVEPLELTAARPVKATGLIIGGRGSSVLPAVRQYVALRGLPARPPSPDLQGYLRMAASGWLDSPIRVGNRFRHAVGGAFEAHPAADAAWMMDELAAHCSNAALARRLAETAAAASVEVLPEHRLHAAVGHVRYPLAPLVLAEAPANASSSTSSSSAVSGSGSVAVNLEQARGLAQSLVRRFEPDGSIRYRAHAGGTDYGRTHFCDEASGLTAEPIARLLEASVFAGDRELAEEGLRLLRILHGRFAQGVPRGAQTWEIPLHTPDVLGSAYLVKAFTLGHELTGEPELLEAAKDWAWTGVPFVYLVHPAEGRGPAAVGPFATIPVLGATNWTAPNWIGLPVQWCGLVFADALFDLARHDQAGPWQALAEGIAASGIAQTYPPEHPHRGLLPDSFNLGTQSRNPADINPGTLQPSALRLLAGETGISYAFRALRQSGLWVHAPGQVGVVEDRAGLARFTIRPWSARPSYAVIHGVGRTPSLTVNGQVIPLGPDCPHQHLLDRGTLIVRLDGTKPMDLEVSLTGAGVKAR